MFNIQVDTVQMLPNYPQIPREKGFSIHNLSFQVSALTTF